jgi:quinol monooxygenase YgiN
MIVRIVKLTFKDDTVDVFLQGVFEQSKTDIRAFPGCLHMELLQSSADPNVLYTLSRWADAEALEQYRGSALFKKTWAATKVLFGEKAEAWSTTVLDQAT